MAIDPFANCNFDVLGYKCTLETCCLAQSSFNYLPSFSGNLFFTIVFGLLIIPQGVLGYKYKTWGYAAGSILGFVFELLGYAGRVRLHQNPFDGMAFWIYLIAITIAPVFICAAIYLCLARIIALYGVHNSRLAPRTIAIGFMVSDFMSLVLQAAGGAITSVSEGYEAGRAGVRVMIAGLILQVISLGFFFVVCADFAWRCRSRVVDQTPIRRQIRRTRMFKTFGIGLLVATAAIMIRSIFRVAELWEGFGGELWNNEVVFMVLDGAMVCLASVILSALHPGLAFGGQWAAADWSFKTNKCIETPVSNSDGLDQRSDVEYSMN